jgi:hypothetical protein
MTRGQLALVNTATETRNGPETWPVAVEGHPPLLERRGPVRLLTAQRLKAVLCA